MWIPGSLGNQGKHMKPHQGELLFSMVGNTEGFETDHFQLKVSPGRILIRPNR